MSQLLRCVYAKGFEGVDGSAEWLTEGNIYRVWPRAAGVVFVKGNGVSFFCAGSRFARVTR